MTGFARTSRAGHRNLAPSTSAAHKPSRHHCPEMAHKPSGLVHFKSVLDPVWREEDLSLVLEGPHSWIVLLLSPTEHFYELEPSIRALAAHSPRIMIWRPDTPDAAELERLRRCALQTQNPEPSSPAAKRSASYQANKEEAQEILTELYVKRGKLLMRPRSGQSQMRSRGSASLNTCRTASASSHRWKSGMATCTCASLSKNRDRHPRSSPLGFRVYRRCLLRGHGCGRSCRTSAGLLGKRKQDEPFSFGWIAGAAGIIPNRPSVGRDQVASGPSGRPKTRHACTPQAGDVLHPES